MCAICGVIEKTSGLSNTAELVKNMCQLAAYRGPDASGFCSQGAVHLGHQRLAIIDTSAKSNQPFQNDECVVVFNGEIYNHKQLRAELENYPFVTDGDTEVVLAAYKRWGEDCVEHFSGMWAFVLYDKKDNKLFCSRDRFGIKPFYYYQSENLFTFASEIKQFTCLPKWQATANTHRLLDFLRMGLSDHTNQTMFEGVYQLPAGHNLSYNIDSGAISLKQYYNIEEVTTVPYSGSYSDAQSAFCKLFAQSVENHLQSDVPLGSCLSGGLDSTAIVSQIKKILDENNKETRQYTVSSCSTDPRFDEQEYIDEVVKHFSLENDKVFPAAEQLFQKIEALAWHQDEPFGSSSIFAQWLVFQQAEKQHVKVVLDGQGADEILAGYNGVLGVLLAEKLRSGHFLNWITEITRIHNFSGQSCLKLAALSILELLPLGLKSKLFYSSSLFAGSWATQNKNYYNNSWRPFHLQKHKTMREYSISLLTQTSLPRLLHYEDRNSMAASVEARVPFLDHELVEFLLKLPSEYKIKDGVTKRIMRDALGPLLPDKVRLRRTKLGFEAPESTWIRENPEIFHNAFEEGLDFLGKLVNKQKAFKWYNKEIQKNIGINSLLWRVVSIGVWARVFKVELGAK